MTLAEKLDKYSPEYWNFPDYHNDSPLIRYPAVMVPPMQACIMKEIIKSDANIRNVFDPFSGSGTALCEGRKLGLDVIGFDINPLSMLLTRVNLEKVPQEETEESIRRLFSRIALYFGHVDPYSFDKIDKWFNKSVISSLSVLRHVIMLEKNDQIRRFLWCCMAETVRRFCNSRSSTFKLHIKSKDKISSFVDDSIPFFRDHVREQFYKFLRESSNSTGRMQLKCGDSKKLIKTLPNNSIDMICTSPPYGDNMTTVTYGQFSILQMLWIDKKDLPIWNNYIIEKFTGLDAISLGGKSVISPNDIENYSDYLQEITPPKQKKIVSFLKDYENVFASLTNVLKQGKLMVLTLGNRRVDNHEIRFDLFNDMLAEKYGLVLDSTITRRIIGKRMPTRVSNVNNCGPVSSMNKEYVKIYRKVKKNERQII